MRPPATPRMKALEATATEARSLLEKVHERVRRALRLGQQKDDITMVLLRRREPSPVAPATLPFRSPAARNEAGDVSL